MGDYNIIFHIFQHFLLKKEKFGVGISALLWFEQRLSFVRQWVFVTSHSLGSKVAETAALQIRPFKTPWAR